MEKIGLVLEGGASRGVFTAGVLDYWMEQGITFPYVGGYPPAPATGRIWYRNRSGVLETP